MPKNGFSYHCRGKDGLWTWDLENGSSLSLDIDEEVICNFSLGKLNLNENFPLKDAYYFYRYGSGLAMLSTIQSL